MREGGGDCIGILSVDEEHDALIILRVSRHRCTIDQKSNLRAVGVITFEREQDRLLARLRLSPCAVRQEAVVAKSPQLGVERLEPFL